MKVAMFRAVARTQRQEWLAQGVWPDGERQLPPLHPDEEAIDGAPPQPLLAGFVDLSIGQT